MNLDASARSFNPFDSEAWCQSSLEDQVGVPEMNRGVGTRGLEGSLLDGSGRVVEEFLGVQYANC